jgi:hypothetical protein
MPPRSRTTSGHAGRTDAGHTRDLKIERLGPVTIYKRGLAYYLYFRERGTTRRTKVDGNLAVARATAAKVAAALTERRPSPFGHDRTSPVALAEGFLGYVAGVQKLALRTQDRYRAALERFLGFCAEAGIATIDAVDDRTVEDFVRWLRGQTRTRNGAAKGRRASYKVGGIKFILSTCRTAFTWAGRRRMLTPTPRIRSRASPSTPCATARPTASPGSSRPSRSRPSSPLATAGSAGSSRCWRASGCGSAS